jgi:hypothetical protein
MHGHWPSAPADRIANWRAEFLSSRWNLVMAYARTMNEMKKAYQKLRLYGNRQLQFTSAYTSITSAIEWRRLLDAAFISFSQILL